MRFCYVSLATMNCPKVHRFYPFFQFFLKISVTGLHQKIAKFFCYFSPGNPCYHIVFIWYTFMSHKIYHNCIEMSTCLKFAGLRHFVFVAGIYPVYPGNS